MNSNQNPVIAREIITNFKKITDWLDYYHADWPTEIEPRPVIYLKPTEGGHDQRRYYYVLAAPELKAVPYEEYFEQNFSQIEPNELKLGFARIDEIDPSTIRLFVWSEDGSPPEIWKDLFDNLMMVFHPDNTNQQMVDTSLLKYLTNQSEVSTLPMVKPGRKPDKYYDEAFKRINGGEDYEDVFEWFCNETGITHPDKLVRDSFRSAMKRR